MSTLASVFGYGLLSARPAASVAGRFYYATDTTLMYRDNGSSWDTLSVGAGSVASDAIWDAAGDLAVGTGANTAAKLTLGGAYKSLRSNGSTAIWDGFHGVRCTSSATQTVVNGVTNSLAFDTEKYDTDTFHFTSASNLTGTFSKTASSAAIIGSSTLFTSELSVGQVVAWPGTATEIGVVKTITDDTHLTLWQTMANTASGQTAQRRNDFIAIPSGMGGYYRAFANARWSTVTTGKVSTGQLGVNGSLTVAGTIIAVQGQQSVTSSVNMVNLGCDYSFVAGDYIALYFFNGESGTVTISNAAEYGAMLGLTMIGV